MTITPRLACLILALSSAVTSGCSDKGGTGPIVVSVIGDRNDFAKPLAHLPDPGAKLFLEATAQGLVAFDAAGDILPALAQRWIVEEDGRSYIFRLRRARWADGTRVTAADVARILSARIASLRRLDPTGPLDAVEAVVPMTGEVIEIRMVAPRPFLLQMLAQPQMALLSRDGGTGPYRPARRPGTLLLEPADAQAADDADEDGDAKPAGQMRILRAERAALAIARFSKGYAALLLGGRLTDLPLLTAAGIDRGSVRLDPVQGLFGLAVSDDNILLDDDGVREAISMAIDRDQLLALFPLGGWAVTDQILPQQFDLPRDPTASRWADFTIADRRSRARAAIDQWRSAHGDPPTLRIALPAGAGSRLLFASIDRDLRAVGLASTRVAMEDKADLRLIDEVAAYDSALWYLGRIGCSRHVHCSGTANAALHEASLASTLPQRMTRVADAEALMQAHNGYIPLGAPVRWSLVARRLNGFTPSPRARHPLNHLLRATN
ncbi:ABC transporter substrate-binding protein [Sphingobium sp. AN558]|uniref:ABC transporter substrate-binding protein n=1 Tax=Sphingobium sp. AN558 TaxID=3133442 RepID=UPI0030BACFDA